MFTAQAYAMPQNVDEAYQILTAKNTNCILGGCAWLRLGQRRIHTAVDLSACGLDFIREDEAHIEIGAMTSYRKVETDPIILGNFSGVLSRAVAPIIGTQFRNTVTVGGSVFSRFWLFRLFNTAAGLGDISCPACGRYIASGNFYEYAV